MGLPTPYQEYIHLSRYARYRYDEKRRETWEETVERYFEFFKSHLKEMCDFNMTDKVIEPLKKAVINLEVMPSMRCLMTAGEALKRENVSGYNCSYITVDGLRAFDEMLYVLMNGTGVGFSVERQYVNHLPSINEEFYETNKLICFSTHFAGKIGCCARVMILAAQIGVKEIYMIGMDGPKPMFENKHAFKRVSVKIPSGITPENAHAIYLDQYNVFWDYMRKNWPNTKCISLDNNIYHETI